MVTTGEGRGLSYGENDSIRQRRPQANRTKSAGCSLLAEMGDRKISPLVENLQIVLVADVIRLN
jgi:hypothetical protein